MWRVVIVLLTLASSYSCGSDKCEGNASQQASCLSFCLDVALKLPQQCSPLVNNEENAKFDPECRSRCCEDPSGFKSCWSGIASCDNAAKCVGYQSTATTTGSDTPSWLAESCTPEDARCLGRDRVYCRDGKWETGHLCIDGYCENKECVKY